MKVTNLYIISASMDTQIKGSARGFLYKYMMNCNAENIFVYEMNAESTVVTLQTRAEKKEGGGWTLSTKLDSASGEENEFTKFADTHLSDVNSVISKSTKNYKITHQNGAIIICHASSMALCDLEPELFAQRLIAWTKHPDDEGNDGVFPVFDKIVFNACKSAKHFEKASELKDNTNFWSDGKKKIGSAKKAPEINVANFTQAGKVLEVDADYQLKEEALIHEIELRSKYFNPIFRFLNIYGKKFNKTVIVAGYDEAITAADTGKQLVDNNNLAGIERIKLSGKRMLLQNASTVPQGWVSSNGEAPKHKVFYKFTAQNGNVSNAALVPISWSDWSDH